APAPLKKDSLKQELEWDLRGDDRKPAADGPFKARVRLGLQAKLERHLGWNPYDLRSSIAGIAVDPKGELYVLDASGKPGRAGIRVFGPDGKYRRTILPYPADTPKERAGAVGQLEVNGERLPIIFGGHSGNACPLTAGIKNQTLAFSPKGHLLAVSAVGTWAEHGPPRHLLAFHPEGGAPADSGCVGPEIRAPIGFLGGAGEASARYFDHLTTSPDGEHIYFVPFKRGAGKTGKAAARHAVFRLKWSDQKLGAPFLGKDREPGDDDAHFNTPRGLATDSEGRLYVCDQGNNRVMVFSPQGKLLGKFAAKNAEQIQVHPQSGEIYVTSPGAYQRHYWKRKDTLLKFAAWKDGAAPRQLASLPDKCFGVIALDPAAKPPRLWSVLVTGWSRWTVAPVIDKGGTFEVGASIEKPGGFNYPMYMAADPARNRLLIREMTDGNWKRYQAMDLETEKLSRLPIKAVDVALDRDGNIYTMDGYGTNSLSRYTPDGKPLPFPGTGTHKIKAHYRGYGPNMGIRGHCVDSRGNLYVMRSSNYGGPGQYGGFVDQFGPDGKMKKEYFIDGMGYGDCGIGVDAAGNTYVGVNVKPKDAPFPKGFAGQAPAERWLWWKRGKRARPWYFMFYNTYLWNWGAVMKFGPEGGVFYGHSDRVRKGTGDPRPTAYVKNAPPGAASYVSSYLGREVKVVGAKWRYPGFGAIQGSNDGPTPDPGCVCYPSRIAVDGFGRVFMPNPFIFSVEMLDAAGNRIERIGRYGNADSAGPKSKLPEPEIAFAWGVYTSTAGGKLYVGDSVNRRVTVIKFDHAAEAVRALP
ncbi:MAG: NHL repeat-containing protein, partial [Planctomycetota bacterium]